MKNLILLLILIVSVSLEAQVEYTIDTSGFQFLRLPDSTDLLRANNILRTDLNFRIQANSEKGYIVMKALKDSEISLYDENQHLNVLIRSEVNESGGAILLSDKENDKTNVIRLVTNYNNSGDARIITEELQINGGSDVAELFEVNAPKDAIVPGRLVSLDARDEGALVLSQKAYDPLVAGVISGANGIKPGILMGQDETIANGDELVTITGRTYVTASNVNGDIKVGDLLTSSSIPGVAMKATKKRKMKGAVIGKAMTSLESPEGYVLVLIHLQ